MSVTSDNKTALDQDRIDDVQQKHDAIARLLSEEGYDGLLLQRPENFSWITSGGDCTHAGSSQSSASLFITSDARVVLCNNVDSAELFDRELPGLGFQLKERPWEEPRTALLNDLCRGRKVASDTGYADTPDWYDELKPLRLQLSDLECKRMRELGRKVAHAVEAAGRQCWRGQTEAEIAGQVAHRLIKHHIHPERIQVSADGQSQRYRNWSYGDRKLDRCAVISATGRQHGLCVGTSRTVSFGEPPADVREAHQKTLLMQATGMFFSQDGWTLEDVWKRVNRIYEKFGHPDEWRAAEQAEVVGYTADEVRVVPDRPFQLKAQMAMHWHPSVGPATLADTILVLDKGVEVLTPMEQWPKLKTEIKGVVFERPDILRREWQESTSTAMVDTDRVSGDSVLVREIPQPVSETPPVVVNDSIFNDSAETDSIFD